MIHQDKTSERDYYDQLFSSRKRFDQFRDDRLYEMVASAARHATAGHIALDLGCGSGTQALCLMREGFAVVSADLSSEAAALCRANTAGSKQLLGVVNADAESLPFRDASMDACICSLFLHHFKSLETVAAELRRVVRPGGVVVATDANAHNPFVWLFFNVIHRVHRLPWVTPDQRAITSTELAESFGRHGFGEFQFSSFATDLRRDWLGRSLAFSVNFHLRRSLLTMSQFILPPLARGNGLLSTFRRMPDDVEPSRSSERSVVKARVAGAPHAQRNV
ncbi:MAG TPA: class I SAM-dependent methyltransferase [Vicinamibacterales bacterium]|nr:class I SAM-dependent methyltransferase [Vicinamibacterales bacterium]